jgi:hypothetical protein
MDDITKDKDVKRMSIETNMLWELADVTETMLLDLNSSLQAKGYKMKYDAKHAYNTAIRAVKNMLYYIKAYKENDTKVHFGKASDTLLYMLLLINDRITTDEEMRAFIKSIEDMPSKLNLNLEKYK